MDDKLKKLQGEHLKEIRKMLGLSQKKLGLWLSAKGVTNNCGEPYKEITIASWENGRRKIPEEVMKAISENVNINGHKVQASYLHGSDKYMTSSDELLQEAIRISYEIIKNSHPFDFEIPEDKQKAFNKAIHEMLAIYEINENEIPNFQHFSQYMYQEFQEIIDSYISSERNKNA